MNFTIAARLKPFCHRVGTTSLIPYTTLQVQVFPTKLCFTDLANNHTWEEVLSWQGPVDEFTVELDLEKGHLYVFGKTAQGFRHLHIKKPSTSSTREIERLSLGKHTKLDWELVCRRMDMQEIVPVLFQLGQLVPLAEGTTPILQLLRFADKTEVCKQLTLFFKAGFYGLVTPRLHDTDWQGIVKEGETAGSPLVLLKEAYQTLRSLFFQEADGFSFLPYLPPQFHAGRLLNLQTEQGDKISLEWSKKQIKKVLIRPAVTRTVPLTLQKMIRSFRINKKSKQAAETPLSLVAGQTLFLDRFEK